jgi:hypothetical protein
VLVKWRKIIGQKLKKKDISNRIESLTILKICTADGKSFLIGKN